MVENNQTQQQVGEDQREHYKWFWNRGAEQTGNYYMNNNNINLMTGKSLH